jgi:RND family efflux transporter MFP subunit
MKPLLGLLGIALAILGCGESQAGKPQQPAAAPTVNVVAVKSKILDTTISLPAQLAPYEAVSVYPKVTGFIERISVDRGSRVRAGQVIAELSAPELLAQRSQAEAALQKSQADYEAAKAKLASDQATYAHLQEAAKTPGVVAGNDVVVAEQTTAGDRALVQAAANNVHAAQESLKAVTQLESYLKITAPFDGVVTERNLHPGALVGPSSGASGSQPILQIASLRRLRLVVPVPEAYVAGVREGTEVSFTVPEFPGQTFRAPIARIANAVDEKTRTMPVELEVRNTDARLTPGVFASVQWTVRRSYPTLFVPSNAVANDLQRTFVVRVADGKADWVDVKTGMTSGDSVEVFGNLHEGDQVVSRATDELKPGAPVQTKVAE